MVSQLNAEFSPFKDQENVDSKFVTEMLDLYRKTEDFQESTSKRRIKNQEKKVHSYLKVMESGELHPDTQTIMDVQRGALAEDSLKMKKYLMKRL